MALNNRQRVFVDEYLKCWNASEAARVAGYKTRANEAGRQVLSNTDIQAEIKRRLSEKAMDADEVLARLAEHARGNFSPFLRSDGAVDLTSETAKANIGLLKKVKVKERILIAGEQPVREIETEIELHDSQAALVHIGRHHKLFTDKFDIDDSGISDEERASRITAILDKARTRRD